MEMQLAKRHAFDGSKLSRSLGWFSLGLGATEVAAPRALAKLIGVRADDATRKTMRAYGVREIVQGVAILQWPERAGRVWARVLGDALDIASLAYALRGKCTNRQRIGIAIGMVLGVTALDVLASKRLSKYHAHKHRPALAITVNRPPSEVYDYWSSLDGFDVDNVTFTRAPDGLSTEVRVVLPTGKAGMWLSRLFGKKQVPTMKDLRRMKQEIEVGEEVYSDASIHRRPHPGQPSKGDRP